MMSTWKVRWPFPAVPLALLALLLVAGCGGGGGGAPVAGGEDAIVQEGPFLYDGSLHEPLGDFRITDLRSRMVETDDGDSIDTYASKEDYEARDLTLFHEPGATGRPVVLFIHGGGWTDGYREWYHYTAEAFTGEMGYVTVVANYRLTSDQVFPSSICPTRESEAPDAEEKAAWYPDNLRDCADALAWTADHVEEYGGDPNEIFLFGHSAGGHLVSLLALHDDYDSLRARIRGVISMSGAYDLGDLNDAMFGTVLDLTFDTHTNAAVLSEASPETYVAAGDSLPPFLVLYCEDELPSLTSEALSFIALLENTGHEVESEYLAGYSHVSEMNAIEFSYEAPTARIIRFIEDRVAEDGP